MRVLYLHQYFATPSSSTGTRSYEVARRLVQRGHQVTVITSTAQLPKSYRSATRKIEIDVCGIRVIALPIPYSNNMAFANRILSFVRFALASTIEAMRHEVDVIFATSTPLTIAIPGIAATIRHRKPMVFEVRDLWPELPIAVGALRNPLAKVGARALEWLAYHSSAHVVALSPGMADGVVRRGIPRERVTVIPNSCDVAEFDVPAERGLSIRERLGLRPDQPLVVYAGTLGQINGVGYLVDVAAAMRSLDPTVQFLIVGDGAERAKVKARAGDLGVLDVNLRMWESLPKTEMPALLSSATVACSLFLPIEAMWHNSANKLFDALAAGKPVVINYGGWQADILSRSGAGLVLPPGDPRAAAELLTRYLADKPRLERAREAARGLARERFNRDDLVSQLEAVLRQVAGDRTAS